MEVYNAGYSLKPVQELGTGASELRNPILASFLYDLNFAETKGSGIRTSRMLLREANLAEPNFISSVTGNSFRAIYSLNQLMSKDDLVWLGRYKDYELDDSEARALLIAKHLGAVNNSILREETNLDTLQASHVLRKLAKEKGLLKKHGAGSATTYTLKSKDNLKTETPHLGDETPHLGAETPHLGTETSLPVREDVLQKAVEGLGYRPRKEKIFSVIVSLCLFNPQTKEELMQRLDKGEQLIRRYLKELREKGILEYTYPQIPYHPTQAYKVTELGKKWLKEDQG